MNTVKDKLDVSASSSSSSAGLGPTLSVSRPSPAQSNTDVSKYAEELIKDPTVLRSATSISRMFKGGSKNNVTTIFAKNLIESATSDLQIEIESCSSMSSGSCESGMDMMDSVLNITGLIEAEKNRIKGECSREDLGLLSQITKFKPISRETTETHQRGSTHELVHRRDSKGATTEHLHKSQSITTMADVRQGKIRTASGKTLRIRCSKTNEILRQKMIYNARQELAPPKKKKFKTIAKAVAWTVRNRLAFMKGDAPKTKEQEDEEKIQKLAKIFTTNVIKGAVKKYELEERQEAIRQERRRRANRRKFTTTPNFFGELEDFPDPRPWVKKFDKNHNPNNKALTYWVREIQRQEKEHELGPPPPGLDLPCSNLSLRHSKHSDLKLACHAKTEEDEPTFSGRKNSSIYFAGITKIGDSDDPQVREENKLGMAIGGAPAEKEAPGASSTLEPLLKPSEKTDSPQTGKASKPDYLGGKSGGSNVTREAKGAGMTGLFPANDVPSGKKSPKSGGILKVKDDKKKGVKSSVQKDQGSEMSPALTNETRTQARKSSSLDADALGSSAVAIDEPVPIWTKAPKEKKSWTTPDKPRDMTDPRVDAPYMLRSLTEVRLDKSVKEMEEPPPAPRSSECLIRGMEGLASASGSSGGARETEPAQTKRGARVRPTAVADSVVSYGAEARVKIAVQKITVSVTEGLMANNRSLRILNRAVSIINPVVVATEAELFNPTLLGELVHQVNQTYSTMEAATLGLTMFFVEILSGVLARAANLMPLIGATEEGGLPVLPSNAPVDRTDTAASTGNRLLAIRVSPPPSVSGVDDQNATDAQPRSERQKTKLSKGRYPVREQSPGIKNMMPTASMPRKASIPCMKRDPLRPHTAAESGKSEKPGSKQGAKVESDKKRSPPKSQKSDGHEEPEGTIWKVPDRRRRSSLHPEVVEDLKNTLQHCGEDRQEKKQSLHFTSQSSAMSQKSTVTKYGKGKKKDTTSLESSQAVRKTALAFTPPPPPPPLPGCLPGGSALAQAAPVVYTTQTAEVGQRATVSSREQDGTEISTETATMATMVKAQFAAPPAAPPLPPPDYYLSGGDKSDDKTPKAQALLQEAAMVYVPPQFLARFQSKEFRHVEFHPSPRSSVTSSVAGSDVGSVQSSRATSPTGTPRSSSPVGRDHTSQGVQSTALASALRDVAESRDTAHGMMQTQRDSLAFRLQSQATQLKHSTTVRRKTSTGETEDTAEASHMVATVQTNRIPSPPPLPSFGLGLLSAHPVSAMPPLSPVTLGQVLHNAIGRRDHAVPGHMQSGSPGNDSLSFRLQSQATKLKHSTTVRRKTSTGETEDTAEASQVVAAVQAEHIPTPSLPAFGLGAHAQITPPAELAIPGSVPTMGLLSHRPTAPGLPMPQLGGLTGPSLSGGTAMHHTSTSAKVTQKTSVKKGDETVENVAEASQAMATTEVAQIPPPPPLPTPEQLRRPSLPRATPHLMVHGAGFGRVPSPPTLPPMDLLMAGISGGFGRVPSPPALPPMDLLMAGISGGFGRVPSPPALPPMELLMAGISGGFGRPQPNMALQLAGPSALTVPQPSLLSHGRGQGGDTFMRSTTASNKMTHKTKVTKGDETVENVAEASETVGTMEFGHIPEPPPLPTPEQLRRPSLPQATPNLMMHGAGFGRVPSPPALPPIDLLMSGLSGGFGRVPSPPTLPPMQLLMAGISGGPGRVPSPPALPPMQLLMAGISGGFGRPQPNMALQLAGPSALSVPQPSLLSHGHGQGGGTFMRSTTASNKMTHKTKVTKGDETVENVAEASNTVGTMEVGHIPEPPPLPTPEQLRRPSLPPAAPQLNMPLQMAGPSALATPQYPPSLMSPGQGHGGGTFMRSTTASNKMTHKTKVTKGDEMVENVAEASETVGAMEFGHIPEPPPLPTPEQLRRPSLPQATPNLMMNGAGFGRVPSPPALPPMDLLMAGISGGFGRPQPNMALQLAEPSALSVPQPSLLSHGHGQGGGTFMRSTTASNKMTHKTKVTKGNETVENVAEASNTVGTMEVGHIPEPPPLPTPEQLRRPSLPPAVPQLNMPLQMAGPSALATPQYPPSLMCPGQGQGGGAFMRSTTASNKMTHKTKVTKGDESVEDVAEASETVGTMEFGHIPEPPPLPTPEQLRHPSLSRATPNLMMHGAGFELVPSPPALPPMELLMAGITDISGRVPSPPALPTMEFLMSEIRYTSRQVPNPPALPTMEFLMSGISGFPERDASQASPRPLLDLVGSGAMQPVPDPNRQYTVMSMYAAQESTLSQKRTVTHRDEGTEHSTAEEFSNGTKAAVLHTNIPEPPLLPMLKYFVQKPYDHPQDTFEHQITQTVDRFFRRRELSIKLHQDKEDVTEFLLGLEEDKSQISPEKLEEVRAEANEELAIINASISNLLMTTSLIRNVVEDSGSQCSEESLEPGVVVSADDYQTATEWIKSDSKLTINLERPLLHELQGAEQHQLSLCNHTDHGESAWYQCDNNYQVVHGEDTPCCMIDHAHHWTYEPTRFKCGSCNEPLLIKYHIETDSEDDDEKDEGHKKVPVPICNTKKHGHEHTWTYHAIRMTCKQCHVTMVMKMHLESDDEDEVPVERSVPIAIHHRAPRKDPRTHTCRIQSRSEDSASQIPLVRKPSQTSERKYPYRQPGKKAYSSGKERPSRSLPKPKVVVTPEMRPQPASETELASVMAKDQSSAAQGRTSLKSVYIQTAGGSTSPPGSAAGKTGKQSAKGSAEPAAKTQKDTVKGGKAGMMRKEYSKKVWDALVGDVNESRSSKAQPTPSKYAKKPDSASKDAATKRSGPKAFTKKDMSSKLKGSQEAGASGTPKKVVVTSKDLPSKPTASTKVASTSSTAKSSPPSKEANPPVTGPDRSGQTKESTQDKKEKPSLEASQKGAIVPKAGPSGDQTAKSAPTKILQATKGVDVKGETPIMRTTALSPRRADMQSTEKKSLKETAPSPSKIPRPVQDTTVKRKDPTMGTTALSPRRTGIQATDKPVKQTSLLPTKIPQPTQGNAVRRKVPTMGTEALSPRCTDIQATDKPVKQISLSPMKIQQPSKDTAVKRNTPVMDRTPVSQRHTGASQGVPPKSEPMKTIQ
ncbi:uncharacterized protein LOC144862321, partial [Branchiostoma floridae x Branchiostoma japonicum]